MRNILRASRGITSSLLAFWLIPAIRRKERRGPGIVAVAAAGDSTERTSAVEESWGTAPRTRGANPAQTHAPATNRTERRRGYFIADTHPEDSRDIRILI